jgi:phosphatidylglycerol---prolipoprotein diacylglyceryl transferase
VLLLWRGHAIGSYPAFLYLGVVFGLAAGNLAAHAFGLNAARVYVAGLLLVAPALVGARLAFVAGNWSDYRRTPGLVWRRSTGGQAMYGGLVIVPVSIPLLAVLHVPFAVFWDVTTFSLLTGMVFTRVGCLLTGCCAGRPTESRFGMVLADARGVGARRIPTQVLEAGLGAAILAGAAALSASHPPPGSVFAASLAAYAVGRLFLQPLRERQRRVVGIAAPRIASVALLMPAVAWIVVQIV